MDRSIQKEERRLIAERESALAAQKRITAAERRAKEAAEDAARQSEAARRKLRNRWRLAVSATVVALLAFGGYEWRAAQQQLDRATQALAAGILADLDLQAGFYTARQRNVLQRWMSGPPCATADIARAPEADPALLSKLQQERKASTQ